jgi:hypothetical protein
MLRKPIMMPRMIRIMTIQLVSMVGAIAATMPHTSAITRPMMNAQNPIKPRVLVFVSVPFDVANLSSSLRSE